MTAIVCPDLLKEKGPNPTPLGDTLKRRLRWKAPLGIGVAPCVSRYARLTLSSIYHRFLFVTDLSPTCKLLVKRILRQLQETGGMVPLCPSRDVGSKLLNWDLDSTSDSLRRADHRPWIGILYRFMSACILAPLSGPHWLLRGVDSPKSAGRDFPRSALCIHRR